MWENRLLRAGKIAVQPGRTWPMPARPAIGPSLSKKKLRFKQDFQPENSVLEEFSKKGRK
jgi:hypothetical protein